MFKFYQFEQITLWAQRHVTGACCVLKRVEYGMDLIYETNRSGIARFKRPKNNGAR